MANIADLAVCTVAGIGGTTAGSCTTKTSCCALISATAGGAKLTAGTLLCLPVGSVTTTAVLNTGDAITGITDKKCYPVADCKAASTGASTLAVSAAALATAVYMM